MASANETRGTKKALIIGNNSYHIDPLRSCLNDASDIGDKLQSFGFQVTLCCNLTYAEMSKQILQFTKNINRQDFVVFFFSGHGLQLSQRNYLIPIDNQWIGNNPDLCKSLATCAQIILDDMVERKPFAIIFLLDCCREEIKLSTGTGTKGPHGKHNPMDFAPMQAHAGSLIVFACGPNQKALDNSPNKRNSLFTYHLLEQIVEPNVKVEEMMARVCGGVCKDSNDKIQVHRSSSLSTPDIYFNLTKRSDIPTKAPYERKSTKTTVVKQTATAMCPATPRSVRLPHLGPTNSTGPTTSQKLSLINSQPKFNRVHTSSFVTKSENNTLDDCNNCHVYSNYFSSVHLSSHHHPSSSI